MNYKEKAEAALEARSAIIAELSSIEDAEARSAKETEAADLLAEARSYAAKAKDESEAAELRSGLGNIVVSERSVAKAETSEVRNALTDYAAGSRSAFDIGGNLTPVEARAVLTAGTGNHYTDKSFIARVLGAIYDKTSVLRAGATVVSTTSGDTIDTPVLGDFTVGYVPEGGAIPESGSLGKKTLSAYKYGTIALVSHEMLEDVGSNVVDFVGRAAAQAVKNTATKDFLIGDGSNKPAGALLGSAKGADAAAAAITEADVYELFYSVDNADNGTWVMNGSTAAAIRSLNSGLWSVNPGTDNPNLLLGRPVVVDNNMPGIGTGNKSVLFGDFSAYVVRQVNGLRIERSDDYKFGNDLVAIRVLWRADGVLTDANAIKHLLHA